MRKQTQSRPDNCWQTCIAMLLDVNADQLPPQHEYPRERYGVLLRKYLDQHFGVTYVEIGPEEFQKVLPDLKGAHVMIGESPRTTKDNPTWHAIIGEAGKPEWDVNPSRDGLTSVKGYGLLIPTPSEWRASWSTEKCVCPLCQKGAT